MANIINIVPLLSASSGGLIGFKFPKKFIVKLIGLGGGIIIGGIIGTRAESYVEDGNIENRKIIHEFLTKERPFIEEFPRLHEFITKERDFSIPKLRNNR